MLTGQFSVRANNVLTSENQSQKIQLLESSGKEAGHTKKYDKLQKKYDNLEISFQQSGDKIKLLTEEKQALKTQVENNKDLISQQTALLKKRKEDYDSVHQRNAALLNEKEQQQRVINGLRGRLTQIGNEKEKNEQLSRQFQDQSPSGTNNPKPDQYVWNGMQSIQPHHVFPQQQNQMKSIEPQAQPAPAPQGDAWAQPQLTPP